MNIPIESYKFQAIRIRIFFSTESGLSIYKEEGRIRLFSFYSIIIQQQLNGLTKRTDSNIGKRKMEPVTTNCAAHRDYNRVGYTVVA